jgi:SAM-dependent methyltransferase
MPLLFSVTLLVGAALLFSVQPMVARMVLPLLGGSPAVWNTCMVFFQVLLLAGYAYAHESLSRLGIRRQIVLHAVLLLLSLAFLPAAARTIGAGGAPIPRILGSLALIAGVPFFVLSTNSSLTQRWYSVAAAPGGGDPFWLYGASNAGSLAALLSYPLIVEPFVGLRAQLRWWSIGYGVFIALCLVSMAVVRAASRFAGDTIEVPVVAAEITWRRRLRWILLSAIASSLLLSVTMQIATDVVSAPLFWVLPLAIYLLTFIIAFSSRRRIERRLLAHLTTIGIALCFVIVIVPTVLPMWFALMVLLGTLFTGALVCHGDLADDRPPAERLTDFYLALAIGGMLGGVANSIVAPLVFRSIVEYPVTLALLALVLHPVSIRAMPRSSMLFAAAATAVTLVAAVVVLGHRGSAGPNATQSLAHWEFVPLLVLGAGVLLSTRAGVFSVASLLAAVFVAAGLHFVDPIIDQGRSFFGVSRVTESATLRTMIHGVTVHGIQRRDPRLRDIPVSYYYPRGPLGSVVAGAPANANIGIVGLGAGSLAPLTRPGQRLTYFEIDPLVEAMARRDFTYLKDSPAAVSVRIGDGRQLLEQQADDSFDLLVLDAFNSDAIPMHLLTDEALAIYLRKLKPTGLLVLHISNRYADLARVFRGWRRDATGGRIRVAMNQYVPTPEEEADGALTTVAVAIGRSGAALIPLASSRQWYWLDDEGPAVHWTDDRSSVLSVLDRNLLRP